MPRRSTIRAFVALASAASSLPAVSSALAAGPSCVERRVDEERVELTCPLAPVDGARRFRFQANFVGGHDDTRASLAALVDGVPEACMAGSKTSLFGEDGEIDLHCRIERPGRELVVTVAVSHAQYVGHLFTAER